MSLHETIQLLQAAQGGDDSARDELFERYYPRVRQIVALRMGKSLRDLAEHEDLVQETFLDAVKGLHQFEPQSEGGFRNWLARIVENNLRDTWRRSRATKRGEGRVRPAADYATSILGSSILAADQPSPSQFAHAAELEQRLERALLEMSERDRRAIELRHVCGLSHAELARELGVGGESSARAVLARAKARLAEALG